MNRGEIYYVTIPAATGLEMVKTRPAVIVSADCVNGAEGVVIVVFCSASPHRDLPTHVSIRSTARPCAALCEHIYAVDKSRISTFIGYASDDEMQRIDIALTSALGLDFTAPPVTNTPPRCENAASDADALRVELETYKRLYNDLLDRVTNH